MEVELAIDHAMDGDANAFGQLYDVYFDRVYRHIYYRVGCTEDAQDLTQEVFARAWKALPKYRRTATPFLGWLMRISHNRVIDYYRTKKDQTYLGDEAVTDNTDGGNPELIFESKYDQQQIRKAILRLPEEYQQVILMSFIEGFEYPEIASAMGKKEGAVRVIMHRALKKMRDILSKETI
jgi:RNA polymerase sigma-70 factor, ECF subfamily